MFRETLIPWQHYSTKTDLPLLQLLNNSGKPDDFILSSNKRIYIDLVTTSGLEEIAKYAQAIGIHKNLLVPRDNNGKLRKRGAACRQTSPTSLVIDAHAAGLLVHVWAFRNEDCFLPLDFQGNPHGEYKLFFNLNRVYLETCSSSVMKRICPHSPTPSPISGRRGNTVRLRQETR